MNGEDIYLGGLGLYINWSILYSSGILIEAGFKSGWAGGGYVKDFFFFKQQISIFMIKINKNMCRQSQKW